MYASTHVRMDKVFVCISLSNDFPSIHLSVYQCTYHVLPPRPCVEFVLAVAEPAMSQPKWQVKGFLVSSSPGQARSGGSGLFYSILPLVGGINMYSRNHQNMDGA